MLLSSCASTRVINGIEYTPYGVLSVDRKVDSIKYKKKISSIILSIIFVETVIVPVVLIGYKLFEPENELTKGE